MKKCIPMNYHQRLILAHIYMVKMLPVKNMKTKSFYVTCRSQKQYSRRCDVLKRMCRALSPPNANVFLSRNLTPCKIQALSHSFLVRTFSINEQFSQILWKLA